MSTETFQIPLEAAEAYEASFVPAIFAEWAPRILDAAGVGPGDRVLDVACGTGIVARGAVDRVGAAGEVVGLDRNEAMLTVARRVAPDLTWRLGSAEDLPYAADHFDAVTCQMALMFLADREAALREMARVVRPGGLVALVVPAALGVQPAYRVLVEVAVEHASEDAASMLGTYWNCGDLDALVATCEAAGLRVTGRSTVPGVARFASAEDFVRTEVAGSPLAERISPEQEHLLWEEVARRLPEYDRDGRFDVPLLGHVVAATPA